MIYDEKGTNMEYEDVFDSLVTDLENEVLVGDLKNDVLSIQLTNFEDVNHLHETSGRCSMNVKDVHDYSGMTPLRNVEYNGQKYIFMRAITDDTQPSFMLISVDEDERGRKRGMLITSFCDILKLIITFDYQSANSVTPRIFKVLEQYSSEDE